MCRDIAFQTATPHMLLQDRDPSVSILMKNFPEFRCFRDITYYWKWFLNTDIEVFPNYVKGSDRHSRALRRWDRMEGQLRWDWSNSKMGYEVLGFQNSMVLHCAPDPQKQWTDPVTGETTKEPPVRRWPSTATPSFYVPLPPVRTEDDVIYRPNLPSFEDDPEDTDPTLEARASREYHKEKKKAGIANLRSGGGAEADRERKNLVIFQNALASARGAHRKNLQKAIKDIKARLKGTKKKMKVDGDDGGLGGRRRRRRQQVLGQRDSELLISFLTVSYLRVNEGERR